MVPVLDYKGKLQEAKLLCRTSCLEVPWYIPFALRKLGESFVLYLFSEHEISRKFTIALDNFLAHEKHDLLVVAVNVKTEFIVESFSVSILPQLRIYRHGLECRRIHGSKNYDELVKIMAL